MPENFDWQELFELLGGNSAVIELDNITGEEHNPLRCTPDEIKGLDREVIILVGLSQSLTSLQANKNGNSIGPLANRQQIDRIRVALSRSVDLLIVVDDRPPSAITHLSLERDNRQIDQILGQQRGNFWPGRLSGQSEQGVE